MMVNPSLLATPVRRKISLTALIDVVFILLMFFMLTASFNQYSSLALNTPTASESSSSENPQLLQLFADRTVTIPGVARSAQISPEEAIQSLDANAPIVLLPHADTDLQTVLSVFETLKDSGAGQLILGEAWGADGA
jgi:biopolymer transport protein ExbD